MEDHYIAGFVDGEGSFHIAFQKTQNVKLGWQVIPEFHVSQNWHAKKVLQAIQNRFDCGYVKFNHAKSLKDKTLVLVIRNRSDLLQKVVPFFEQYPLHTEKQKDFAKFREVLKLMNKGKHLSKEGFSEILEIAYSMNANGFYRRVKKEQILTTLKSSEAIR